MGRRSGTDRTSDRRAVLDSTRRRALLKVGTGALAVTAGCLGGGGDGDDTVEMTTDLAYVPETLSVSTGTTVTWETVGTVQHSVTAYEDGIPDDAEYFASGGFESESAARSNISRGLVPVDETYDHTFEVAGTYEYFCVPHEGSGMIGTVRVE